MAFYEYWNLLLTLYRLCDDNRLSCPMCYKSIFDMTRRWRQLDVEISLTPMPEEYHNRMVVHFTISWKPTQVEDLNVKIVIIV